MARAFLTSAYAHQWYVVPNAGSVRPAGWVPHLGEVALLVEVVLCEGGVERVRRLLPAVRRSSAPGGALQWDAYGATVGAHCVRLIPPWFHTAAQARPEAVRGGALRRTHLGRRRLRVVARAEVVVQLLELAEADDPVRVLPHRIKVNIFTPVIT